MWIHPPRFIVAGFVLGCASNDYAQLYSTQDLAPSLEWGEVSDLDYMGAYLIDDGVNFTVYSERAERIELLLFDDPSSLERPPDLI